MRIPATGWRALALAALALAAGCSKQAGSAAPAPTIISTTLPFVGCASDGQGGPQPAPAGAAINVQMTVQAAAQLAYYAMANGPGVIGPRGWLCAGIYGSDGATLMVAPQALQPSDVMGTTWAGASGDAIEAKAVSGDTSGRFEVAQVIAHAFPAHQAFVQNVINEGIEPASSFPPGPYPSDKLTPKSNEMVEFQTPANAVGLGTDANINERLKPGADPVSGVAILTGSTPDLASVAVRLPASLAPLAPLIVQRFEADNPAGGSAPAASATPAAPQAPPAGPAAAAQPTTQVFPGGNPNALAVVEDFYHALGQGDGAQASADVIPAKRGGNYSASALSSFYGSMSQPMQLLSATAAGNTVAVRYTFTTAGGKTCNGAANVFTTTSGGVQLISSIQALNGC